ncbi:MAG: PTS fructose transporter subunit IIA, partial [Lactobacillus iners]|nr:PTS fructose transporter subunit IIA [Lactobacillus iners]
MTDILIASHGHFASGLKNSIKILTGLDSHIQTIDAYVDERDYVADIKNFVKNAKKPAVIFTDLKGGSVNQKVMLEVASHDDIYVVTQMNLAIIISILLDSEPLNKDRLKEL